jgi:hypothetical protein
LPEKEIEIKLEISKKAGLLRKPVRFTDVPGRIHESIERNEDLWMDYIDKNPVNRSIQVAADMSKREVSGQLFLSLSGSKLSPMWVKRFILRQKFSPKVNF